MKTLCITGISEPDLVQINTRFCQAGMAEALSIEKNGRQLNMAQWHDRFCSASSLEQDAPGPGKFGDQLASDLFFSNIETPFWGWADSRSTFLLDFWVVFDPRVVFVLTCCPLDHHLARLMEAEDAASLNLDDLITSWQQFHAHLLQFYHTHPDRCLLVDIHDSATQFNILNQACRDKWHLPLTDIPESESEFHPFPAPLARHIAAGFTKNHSEAASLWNEIQATVSSLTSDPARPDEISFNHIAQNYQTAKDRSAELRQISDLEKQVATLQKQVQDNTAALAQEKKNVAQKGAELQEREKEITSLEKQVQENVGQVEQQKNSAALKDTELKQVKQQLVQKSTQFQEHENKIDSLQKEQAHKEARFKELEQKNHEINEENDLILQQLHQVQEELESMFRKKQEAEQQWAEKQKRLQTDFKDKEQQLKQREEQITSLQKQAQDNAAALAQEKKNVAQKGTQLQEHENKINSLQKEQAQKEARLKELEQKNHEINEESDLILQQLHQVQEELESMFIKKQEAEQQWAEKQKKILHENEQRLYQLHQVQEELGQYLVKYQEQNKRLEKADARWDRLLKRMPDYYDYGDIRIIQGDDASTLICEVRDLEAGSQTYPVLKFETFLIRGVAGFRFKHPEHITQEDLIPVAQTSEEAKKRSSLLKNLTTTEWLLLESSAQFLKTCLKTEKFDEETLPAPLIQKTLNGLESFNQVISKFPEALRYDEITFDEQAISEDCEYLEICLENLNCGELASPEFVFRVSCAGLSSSDFGSNPRLEFPEDTSTILKTWFDCSSNPDDPGFELRFALPEAMDLEVWNKLSKDDAWFIRMLTAHLPEMIEKKTSQSEHDDSKWLPVAKDVEKILKRHTSEKEEMIA